MVRKGILIQAWMVKCGEPTCKEKVSHDVTVQEFENTIKSLGWKYTMSCGWVCKEHAKMRL